MSYAHVPLDTLSPDARAWLSDNPDAAAALSAFVERMVEEFKANDHKGNRPGWLEMTPQQALAELQHHTAKLSIVVSRLDRAQGGGYGSRASGDPNFQQVPGTPDAVGEYTADVANSARMLADTVGTLR